MGNTLDLHDFKKLLATSTGREQLRLTLSTDEAALILADDDRLLELFHSYDPPDGAHAEERTEQGEPASGHAPGIALQRGGGTDGGSGWLSSCLS